MTTHLDIEKERAEFEREANDARFFPAELSFDRTKSPSGRDEYANSHLQSRWEGWIAARRASLQADEGKDAARYRWLRDKSEPGICAFYLSVGQAFKGVKFARETVDMAIDAAITAKEST